MQAVPPGRDRSGSTAPGHRWVLFAVQLPATPSNARVKVWRRLQQLGAVPIKHAVYVLPYSTQAMEDFAWLRKEVEGYGGQGTVFSASSVEDLGDIEIVEQFSKARAADYRRLLGDVRPLAARARRGSMPELKEVRSLRERFERIRSIDFFGAPGTADAEAALADLEAATRRSVERPVRRQRETVLDRASYRRRTWMTRPRPGVDRFASAWLIRRFIDPDAAFVFAAAPSPHARVVPFDMYDGNGFGHDQGRCTFEVLQLRFGLSEGAVGRIGELVHDVDLKDDRFHAPHAATIELLVEGLRASVPDDHRLLEHGMALFEALYQGLIARHPMPPPRKRRTRR